MHHELIVSLLRNNVLIGALKVGLDASWRLCCHLETTLQDGLREVVDGHRCKDKTEVLMHLMVLDELRDEDLELLHPGLVKMTILQEDPVSFDLSCADQS